MRERFFRLAENNTSVRTEVVAGVTTFLTVAYIIFVQPAVLSGKMFGFETGMDFGARMIALGVAAAFRLFPTGRRWSGSLCGGGQTKQGADAML